MSDVRSKPLLTLLDPISISKLKLDLQATLKRTPLSLHDIIVSFSDRLPKRMPFDRRDRFFDALLQQMRKEGRVESVKRKWQAK